MDYPFRMTEADGARRFNLTRFVDLLNRYRGNGNGE
jgi:hypothetical protein